MKPGLIVICGPTASGKSSLAIDLARRVGGEIISADSMQIYRGFDIGTAKVTPEEQSIVPHHMIDIADGNECFSAVMFSHLARQIISDCFNRGVTPVLCGGTGFYIDAAIYNMHFTEAKDDPDIRRFLNAVYEIQGADEIRRMLGEVDPVSLERIEHNNIKRLIRALEIYYQTGKPASQNVIRKDSYFFPETKVVYMDTPRDLLYERINSRVDRMIEGGLISEVKHLLDEGIETTAQSMQAIGYKETVRLIRGEIEFSEYSELLKRNTRHYAKRQITWFKAMRDKRTLDCSHGNIASLCDAAMTLLGL